MNIGYFINFQWYPPRSGSSIHAYQLGNELVKRGHSINKIFYDYDVPLAKHFTRKELIKFIWSMDVLYIRVHEGLQTDMYTLLKFFKFFMPVVWEINAPLEENLALGMAESEVQGLIRKRKWLAKLVDASINTCDELKGHAIDNLGIKNSFTIPLGSDTKLFSPGKRSEEIFKDYKDKFKVIWAGSAQYSWQGLNIVHEVAKATLQKNKDIIFFIIGKKDDQNLDDIKLENIRIIERVSYQDISAHIASGDMGLCLYNHQKGRAFYRSPLKLFDYMACGLPVVSSKIGQINDVVDEGRNGFLVEDNNIEEIVNHIIFLKNNKTKAKIMGQEARKDVERYYNWERVALETEGILEGLVKKKF